MATKLPQWEIAFEGKMDYIHHAEFFAATAERAIEILRTIHEVKSPIIYIIRLG